MLVVFCPFPLYIYIYTRPSTSKKGHIRIYLSPIRHTSYLVIKKLHATIRFVRDTILDEGEIPFQVLTKQLN